jgi:His-Xaa-Ser system protein HxsD
MDSISFDVDISLYPKDAVLRTGYQFTGRCNLEIVPNNRGSLTVTLTRPNSNKSLSELKSEFHTELLDYSLRYRIEIETKPIREAFIRAALDGTQAK